MLKKIFLKNYRNISNLEIEVGETGNLIIGDNGIGKTNFAESIFYSVYGKPFRTSGSIDDFIGPEYNFSSVLTKWGNGEILEVSTQRSMEKKITRIFKLNAKKVSTKLLPNKFPVLVFAPNTVDIINGEPVLRRDELDNFLAIIFSEYREELDRYKNLLKNKNATLKMLSEGKGGIDTLEFWNKGLAKSGNYLNSKRRWLLAYFNSILESTQKSTGFYNFKEKERELLIVFNPSIQAIEENFEATFFKKLQDNMQKEIIVGKSLYGPQKDDFSILLDGKELRFFGSRGQQRIAALLLKIAQYQIVKKELGVSPVLILDDIMSELDFGNRTKTGQFLLAEKMQFFITSADKNEIPTNILQNSINLPAFL